MDGAFKSISVADVHVSYWYAPAPVADVDRLHRELRQLTWEHRPVSVLLIVREGVPLSPEPSRRRAAQILRELGDELGSVAIAIEGQGFGLAAVRAMFTGIALLLRPTFPWTIARDVDSALQWLETRDTAASSEDLRAGVGQIVAGEAVEVA